MAFLFCPSAAKLVVTVSKENKMDHLLEVKGLSKRYGDVTAVDDIDFHIARGEVFGLLGPNGAGKTTTINIIAQALLADSGEVTIDGLDFKKSRAQIKEKVGYVPQDIAIHDNLSAYENLAYFGGIYGIKGEALKKRIEECLDIVQLQDAAQRRAETYSGGMKRRLNIAAGLMNMPILLIMDEPAVGVDPQSRNHILDSIKRLNSEFGTTILFTSHYMEEVQQLCSRVAIIDHGKIIADSPLDELIHQHGEGIITLSFDQSLAAARESIAALVDSDSLQIEGTTMRVSTRKPQLLLPKILEKLNESQLHASEIEVKNANLETVFLNLTGRSLRD
jgi:ABC-2 type transport system ATP-binding protein